MERKIAVLAAILGILGVIGAFLIESPALSVVSPERRHMVQAVYATGEVEPVYWSEISSQIAGKVDSINVDEGDVITEGEVLLQLDDNVECAKATEYMAQLDYLEKQKKRYAELKRRDHASQSKYDEIISEYDVVKAQLEAQNRVVGRMAITSPLEGMVLKREVEIGEVITPSDVVFWVGKMRPLRITAEVDEEDIALILKGQKVLVKADAFPDRIFEGTISEITPKGDPVDKSFRVRVALPDEEGLMIGMTVEVNAIVKEVSEALVIPRDSIENDHVWVVQGRKHVMRTIQTGIMTADFVQVLDGLDEHDQILAHPPDSIK